MKHGDGTVSYTHLDVYKRQHVNDIDFLTTLAGYVHWQITGEKVLGIGDASGMLPIDPPHGGSGLRPAP